jgi:hypothetical protein
MSFEEEGIGSPLDSEARQRKRNVKRASSKERDAFDVDEDESPRFGDAASHLDEKFPFLTRHIGKYWIGAVALQIVLYVACYIAATLKLDVEAGSWADAVSEEEGEREQAPQQSPFESFVYFTVMMLLMYQIREIPRHVRCATEDELSYLKSGSLQQKMKAITRMKWHQRLCFAPQPLMAIDALVGSMGAGILVFRYAAMKTGCATGITDGLGQLDSVGVTLLLLMALCVGLIITLFFIVTRIHYAHFTAIQDTDSVIEYQEDSGHTPRGSVKGSATRTLLKWYSFSIVLQALLLLMLSVAKDAVAEEGKEGSAGMAKTLYVLTGVGVFYLGHQTGHINSYIT